MSARDGRILAALEAEWSQVPDVEPPMDVETVDEPLLQTVDAAGPGTAWPAVAEPGSTRAAELAAEHRGAVRVADARLLDDVRAWFARFVATMAPADLDLLALWAVHTHVCTETYTTPRLQLDSPVPGSGKTTTLEHLKRLCCDPVLMAAVSSSALLVRMLEAGPRTLLIDEADRSLRPDRPETAEVIAVLNSGYKRGATRPVLVPTKGGGWESREMPTFAPVAIAGNAPNLPADTATRTLRVLLMPDTNGTVDESDWELIEPEAEALAERIAQWCEVHREPIRHTRPTMPEGVTGRFREKCQPLARIAAAAGGRWPQAVAEMAVTDVEQVARDREDGMIADRPHVVLLRHLAECWPDGEPFAPTARLLAALVGSWPQVWGEGSAYGKELTAQRLGRMLASHYGVNSTHSHDKSVRGYRYAALVAPWRRMGVTLPTWGPDGSDASDARDGSPKDGESIAGQAPSEPSGPSRPSEPSARCATCHGPMDDLGDGQATHPNCEVTS